MSTSGKPVFMAYAYYHTTQAHHTSMYRRHLFLKIYPNLGSLRSYCRSYCQSHGHTVVIRSYCRTFGHTVILSVILSVIRSYCRSYGNTVGHMVILGVHGINGRESTLVWICTFVWGCFCKPRPLYNTGWALKRYTRNFANIRLTVDLGAVCFSNMVGDCFEMITSGKPV